MKKLSWLLAGAILAAAAVPALAGGGGKKCSADTQTCLNHMASYKHKGYLGIEYDKTDAGEVVVTKVIAGAPAAKAGFMTGDVLLSRNGIAMSDYEAQKKDKASWKAGAKVTYTVKRKDSEKKLAVTLAEMPEDVFAKMVGGHMISDHMAVTTAAETTESDGK